MDNWPNDDEYQDSVITAVDGGERGWSITKRDGWSFFVPADSPIEPKEGMSIRMYGNGIGAVVRGLFIDGKQVFYRTEAEQDEYFANEMYGKDAADLLARWDEGRGVWSISMGGFGPGYEQALQIAAFEVLRHLVAGRSVETADELLPKLQPLGLSGAQWGAARHLANALHSLGPRSVHEQYSSDRHIQVCRDFPRLEATA